MAVLEKIRVKLGILITVLIAVALLGFIIDPTTLQSTLLSFSSKYDVGRIDGKNISYKHFQKELDYYNNIYTLSTGNQSVPQEAVDQINEMAWQNLIQEYYIIPRIKKAGINVGDEELVDLSQGKEISPLLMQDPLFRDATGNFNRERLLDFIHAISDDNSGKLGMYWSYLQKMMTNQQYFIKYASLLTQSNIITPVELRREIEENNTTSNVDFVLVPMGFNQDSTLKVTGTEIENYYNAHKKVFKQKASRDVEFVAYEVLPSEEDVQETEKQINAIYPDFVIADNLKVFLAHNSDTPFSPYYYKKGELASKLPEIDEFAFKQNATILPVFKKDNTFYAARVSDMKMMPDSVFVRHILLSMDSGQRADSLIKVLNHGGNFSELASQFSLDKNTNVVNPGDIGWMTQSNMIPGMEKVLQMKPGKFEKVHTNYGIHIVNVTERTKLMKKVQLAILSRDAVASKDTYQKYYSQANDLVSKCDKKIEKFNEITQEEDLPVIPVNGVVEGARQLSRYDNVREVVRWIYDAKEGAVSPIITVDNNIFFVVALKKVRKEGYAPISEVAPAIQYRLMAEKRAEKMRNEVASKIQGVEDIQAVAQALDLTVSNKTQMAFGSITDGSTDPTLIGAVAGAQLDKVSGPVAGLMGIYVLQVNNRETGAFYTEDDAKLKSKQIQGFQLNTLPQQMIQAADIRDNRARFF